MTQINASDRGILDGMRWSAIENDSGTVIESEPMEVQGGSLHLIKNYINRQLHDHATTSASREPMDTHAAESDRSAHSISVESAGAKGFFIRITRTDLGHFCDSLGIDAKTVTVAAPAARNLTI